MSYDTPTPANLDAIDESKPLATEDPSQFDDALRQTRAILKEVLQKEHNNDGTHKAAAAESADPNSITGAMIQSSASDDSKRAIDGDHIQDNAIVNRHLDDDAVDTAELAADAVETAKIKDANVTQSKLATDSVSTPKIVANAVTDAKLSSSAVTDANRAVGTDHIKDAAVATAKIADLAVTAAKVANIGNLKLIMGNGVGAEAVTVGGDLSVSAISGGAALFELANNTLLAYAVLKEPPYVSLPGSAKSPVDSPSWFDRPSGFDATWSIVSTRTLGLVSVSGDNIVFNAGSFWVRFSARIMTTGANWAESATYHRSVLYDMDQDVELISGCNASSGEFSMGVGLITFTQQTNVRLRTQRLKAAAGDWWNTPNSSGTSGPHAGDFGAIIEVVRVSPED